MRDKFANFHHGPNHLSAFPQLCVISDENIAEFMSREEILSKRRYMNDGY